MKKKAKLLAVSLITLMVTGMGYSKIAAAAGCAIFGEQIICW